MIHRYEFTFMCMDQVHLWIFAFWIKINLKFINSFLLLKDQAGTKRDKLSVDACTKRINSLLFKVKPGLPMESMGLKWYDCAMTMPLIWSGEIPSNEWLLCYEPLWNCLWEAGCMLWTWLRWSLVWVSRPAQIGIVIWDMRLTRSLPFYQGCGRWSCHC